MQVDDWNDLKAFQAVAESGQIGLAARKLHVDATTVGRRIRRLETHLGQLLFERTREGQTLTEAGDELLAKVDVMAEMAVSIYDAQSNQRGVSGQIRLSVSEGFGIWFLAPLLPQLALEHPELTLDLVASSGFLSPSKREADIAIMLSLPETGPLVSNKLADYSLMLYASPEYLEISGPLSGFSDLGKHECLVGYIPDLLYDQELNYLNEFHTGLSATVRSSSINAQARIIASGGGIGVLPCFIGDQEKRLVRVLPERRITRSLHIVTHREGRSMSRIRFVTDWLTEQARLHHALLMPG